MRDTQAVSAGPRQIALSGVIGGLSYALDLTEGEPPGHAVRTCKIGMRLAQALGLDATTRSHLFYALLLKDAGCSANSARMAALFGADDHVAKRTSKRVELGATSSRRSCGRCGRSRPGGSPRARADRLLAIKREGEVTRALMQARCERGAEIAYMLGLRRGHGRGDPHARRALGRRRPAARAARRGDPAARADPVPRADVEIFHAAGGIAAASAGRAGGARRLVRPRARRALDAISGDAEFWATLATDDDLSRWEPMDRLLTADEERLDRIADAFAGVVDAKSPWTYRHSDRASTIAMGLAARARRASRTP